MSKELAAQAYAVMPSHVFLKVVSNRGNGRFDLIDPLTNLKCLAVIEGVNLTVDDEIEIHKCPANMSHWLQILLKGLFGILDPFEKFKLIDRGPDNPVRLIPETSPSDFAQACWDARKDFGKYSQG